ncbi:hypothetical protein MKX01_002162 [Papaver californicum]|nr:hypothetical protein MKX01_002162 [Papaver californicum]
MTSLKQFSLVALIFGFILVSSFTNAARTIEAVMPQEGGSCHPMLDIPTTCTHNEECTDQCEKQNFHKGGFCLPNPFDPLGPFRCCCYN